MRFALATVLAASALWAASVASLALTGPIVPVRSWSSDAFSTCEPKASASGASFAGSAVEPYLAAGPGASPVLAAAWQQDRWSNGGAQGIEAGWSADGGQTWNAIPLSFTVCSPGGLLYNRASDPWVTVGPDRKTYVSAIVAAADRTGALSGFRVAVSTSSDGATWSPPEVLPSGPGQVDGDEIVSDPSQAGTAYVSWEQRDSDGENTVISRTVDGGASWSVPVQIAHESSTGLGAVGVQLLYDPIRGQLVELAQLPSGPGSRSSGQPASGSSALAALTSGDGGATWSEPHVVADRVLWAIKGYPSVRAADPAVEGVDPTNGTLYVAWQDGRFSHGRAGDIVIARSVDGGATWSSPTRAVAAGSHFLFAPAIAVTATGTVGLSYYRVSKGQHGRYPAARWVTSSNDQARRFGTATRLGRSFRYTMAVGTGPMPHPGASGYFLGDYEGMAAEHSFYLLFSRPGGSHIQGRTEMAYASLPG